MTLIKRWRVCEASDLRRCICSVAGRALPGLRDHQQCQGHGGEAQAWIEPEQNRIEPNEPSRSRFEISHNGMPCKNRPDRFSCIGAPCTIWDQRRSLRLRRRLLTVTQKWQRIRSLPSATPIAGRFDLAPASVPEPLCCLDILHGNADIPEQLAIQVRQFAARVRRMASREPGKNLRSQPRETDSSVASSEAAALGERRASGRHSAIRRASLHGVLWSPKLASGSLHLHGTRS